MNVLTLENLEVYLRFKNSEDAEINTILDKVTLDCNVDFQGSQVHKYIHVLVRNFLILFVWVSVWLERIGME